MNNSRKNDVLRDFYRDLESILINRAKVHGINQKQLNAYFNPLSDEHIAHYQTIYKMKIDLVNRIEDFYFMRFVSSWGNQRFHRFMQKKVVCDQLSQSLKKFDLSSYNYTSNDDYLIHMNKFSELRGKDKLAKGIHSIAIYLKKNIDDISKQLYYSDSDTYINRVANIINRDSIEDIDGIGLTLFSDFIKESKLLDVPKPDLHVLNLYNDIFNNHKRINNVANEKQLAKILGFFYDLHDATGKSIYEIDKAMYMAFAKNPFYLHTQATTSLQDLVAKHRNHILSVYPTVSKKN